MGYIDVENVSKVFDKKVVVNDVSFSVQKGEIFGLIGPNGAGKSTLLNMITGLHSVDSGAITIDGHSISKQPNEVKKRLGFVPQELAIIESISAYANLEFFGSLYGLTGKKLKEAIHYSLEVAGLLEHQKEPVKKFSGGMKRRLNISAAIMHHPELIILDEPTVGVDPQSRNYIFDFLRDWNRKNQTTILYTSHYMEEVEALCDRIFIMDEGNEVAFGTKETIKRMVHSNTQIRLEVDAISNDQMSLIQSLPGVLTATSNLSSIQLLVAESFELPKLIQMIHDQQIELKSVVMEEPSLEEVFLQITGKNLRD